MSTVQMDFDSIKKRIINNISSKSEWASFLNYGVLDNVIDGIVQEMAYQMQYNEYLTYENWWSKARNKSSLLVQSTVHGYVVPRKQGAIGTLQVSTDKNFAKSYGTDIVIPKYFQFSGNDIFVVAKDSYLFSASEDYVTLECKQGEAKTVTFLALGNLYEEKIIEDSNIDNDMFDLYVNNQLWQRVNTLFDSKSTDRVYELNTNPDLGGVTIRFGNGIYGQKLKLNDKIEFKYIATKGSEGNIFSSNIINTVESQCVDIRGKPVKIYVKNTSSIIGGKDYPSIDEIRNLSPKVYQCGDRASTKEDYKTMIQMFPYISKVNVWGAYETNIDNNVDPWTFIPSDENVVHVALLNGEYNNLTNEEKIEVINDLHSKNDPTDIIQFETVEKIPLIFDINATVLNSSYTLTQIQSKIEQTLRNTYGIENMEFNQSIYESDFIRLIDEIDGVDHHTSLIYAKKEFKFTEPYVCAFEVPVYPVSNTKCIFYLRDDSVENPQFVEFANVDENGNLRPILNEEGMDISSSIFYLSEGRGTIIISSGLTKDYRNYTIKLRYGLTNNNILLKSRKDILEYSESDIKVYYPN